MSRAIAIAAVVLAVIAPSVFPQQEQPDAVTTLHVYTNLIQVPVLVLGWRMQRLPLIPARRFGISIDSGLPKPPVHARLEGNDSIALSILMDLSGDQDDLAPHLAETIAKLAPGDLHPDDRVSIYGVDCNLVRATGELPAESAVLHHAIDLVLASEVHGKGKVRPTCGSSLHLRNALLTIVTRMSQRSGRRVLLAITDGHDTESITTWRTVTTAANQNGVAIFGLTDGRFTASRLHEIDFPQVTELSGGIALVTDKRSLEGDLRHFVDLVRGRYILEFPRANTLPGGAHKIDITTGDKTNFVRPAGVSFPVADPSLAADPSTVPTDTSGAPEPGARKELLH